MTLSDAASITTDPAPARPQPRRGTLFGGIAVLAVVGLTGLAIWLSYRDALCFSQNQAGFGLPACSTVEAWALGGFLTFLVGVGVGLSLIWLGLRPAAPPARAPPRHFCPVCGARNRRADGRFCVNCGATL